MFNNLTIKTSLKDDEYNLTKNLLSYLNTDYPVQNFDFKSTIDKILKKAYQQHSLYLSQQKNNTILLYYILDSQ